jgi:hypothetical protein
MVANVKSKINWQYYRLINSVYPPIDLFEDIADPADWGLLAAAEEKTNPRLAESIGNLELVPQDRRVSGHGASYVMSPFVHASPDKPGRFHDGTFGAFYGAGNYETALFETVHHTELFCAATSEAPGWIADIRVLIGDIRATLNDLRDSNHADLLDPNDYSASHTFAIRERANGSDGIVYPSVRNEGGECFAAFYPDVMSIPIQGHHICYHWDGARIDRIRDVTDNNALYNIDP